MPITINPNDALKDKPAILIEGFPGACKTTLALQFPNPWLINVDLNQDGPLRYLRSINKMPQNLVVSNVAYYDDHTPTKPHLVSPEDRFDRMFKETELAIKDPLDRTIIVDSMSTIDTVIYDKVKKQLSIATGTPFRIQDWRPFRDYLMTYISLIRNCGKTVIVCCHVESITNDKNQITGYKPMISTKVGEVFAGFFTDVWLMQATPGVNGKLDVVLKTSRSPLYGDLKNAYLMPQEIKNPTYEEINKYLKI